MIAVEGMMKESLKPILVSKSTAAELLGLCIRSIEHRIKRGELVPVKIGGRTLLEYNDLVEFCSKDRP